MATDDPLRTLEQGGFETGQLSEPQRRVLAQLSPQEADLLVRIRQRLADSQEVQGYVRTPEVGTFVF